MVSESREVRKEKALRLIDSLKTIMGSPCCKKCGGKVVKHYHEYCDFGEHDLVCEHCGPVDRKDVEDGR